MKGFCVYQLSGWGRNIHAMLIKENGECIADHICSGPQFAYGDLWENRTELKSRNPKLDVSAEVYEINIFKEKHPDIFAKAFIERVSDADFLG